MICCICFCGNKHILLHMLAGVSGVVLCARALNCVDGVDLALMQKAITEQRNFFKERKPELNMLETVSPSNV